MKIKRVRRGKRYTLVFIALLALCGLLLSACTPVIVPAGPMPTDTSATDTTLAGSSDPSSSADATADATADNTGDSNATSQPTDAQPTDSNASAQPTQITTRTTATTTSTTTSPSSAAQIHGVWLSYIELESMLSGKTPAQAKTALAAVAANCLSYGMTDIYYQARANSDAYYKSTILPVAAKLQTLIITDGFDPLAYLIAQAHTKNICVHAWINPYRVRTAANRLRNLPVFTDTSGALWYVPTDAGAQQLVLDGLRELLNGYAIDGVQFDDYFYPTMAGNFATTPAAGLEDAFASSGYGSVGDWRRAAVTNLMAACYALVHSKSKVFGISPGHSVTDNYTNKYADVQCWLQQAGYCDYVCPQIYFGFNHISSPFAALVNQWATLATNPSVKLYIGVALYKAGLAPDRYAGTATNPAGRMEWQTDPDLLKKQVQLLQSNAKVSGICFYSYTYFDAATPRSLDSWTENGATVTQTYNKTVAAEQISRMLAALNG